MVSTRQLHACGVTPAGIKHRIASGRLTRVHQGVYRLGPIVPLLGPESAGLLACPGSLLFAFSAGAMWGFAERLDAVHLLSRTQRRSRAGLIVHRGTWDRSDVRVRQGLSLTSPFRTLVDLRPRMSAKAFKDAVWEAGYLRLVTDDQVIELTGAKPVPGSNKGERALVALVLEARLPEPLTNQKVAGFDVDLYWPERRVAVELDGRRSHGHLLAVDRDRRKEMALRNLGIDLVRVGGAQLADESFAVVASIAGALAAAAA